MRIKNKGKIYSKKGKNLKKIKDQIIDLYSSSPLKPLNYKQISSALQFTSGDDIKLVIKALGGLKASGKVNEIEAGKYISRLTPDFFEGTLDAKRNGGGYVITDKSDHLDDDIFIAPKFMHNALDGDRVRVVCIPKKRSTRLSGRIVEVLERSQNEFVGVIDIRQKSAFLIPDKVNMSVDIFIPLNMLDGAKNGEKCIALITKWPNNSVNPVGKIIDILGKVGDPDTEAFSILSQFDLPHRFPEEVDKAAKKIPVLIDDAELKLRRDYRSITTVTIDPTDAKDFDDAISFQILDNGNYEIGVHIADVTHYVHPGDTVDQEARDRATSVYLVDRVVPMLPEVLSNGVCSLRPNEDKLTFACVFEITPLGDIVDTWIGRTVIHSNRRFAYDEVQEILESKKGEFVDVLLCLNDVAKIKRKKRLSDGSIAFDKVEIGFTIDALGAPSGVRFKVQKDAHKLIEEFMLLANKAVAERIALPPKGLPIKTFVYRIHDIPDPEKLIAFRTFIKTLGYDFDTDTDNIAKSMNSLLIEIQGQREENLIEHLAIRTMSKAVYSTENIGHYGLGFNHYTHFTSPIRRYPDMMVHRLLQKYLDGGSSADQATYEKWCKHSGNQEKKAADAERQSTKYFQVLFMQDQVGKSFNGIISGVSEWGIFVEIIENKCEGMVRLREISGDYYTYDENLHRIIGHNSGKVYQLGDQVNIVIKSADLVNRRLEFSLN